MQHLLYLPVHLLVAGLLPLSLPLSLLLMACNAVPDESPDAALPPAPDAATFGQGGEPRSALIVNELVAAPTTGADWFELANRSADDLDLSGAYVTDAPDRLDHFYRFPPGTTLAAGAYLVVHADNGATTTGEGHHAPFQLGEADGLYLLAADGLVTDGLNYLAPTNGTALARLPDHEGLFFAAAPTPGAPNPAVQP